MITNLEHLNDVLQPSVGLSVQNTRDLGLALELVTEIGNRLIYGRYLSLRVQYA